MLCIENLNSFNFSAQHRKLSGGLLKYTQNNSISSLLLNISSVQSKNMDVRLFSLSINKLFDNMTIQYIQYISTLVNNFFLLLVKIVDFIEWQGILSRLAFCSGAVFIFLFFFMNNINLWSL